MQSHDPVRLESVFFGRERLLGIFLQMGVVQRGVFVIQGFMLKYLANLSEIVYEENLK